MTETEPEFDVNERDDWYALVEFEVEVCPDCGNLRAICSDPEQLWYPQRHVCYATKDLIANNRRWQKRHAGAKPVNYRLPMDGERLWVATEDLNPDDKFMD